MGYIAFLVLWLIFLIRQGLGEYSVVEGGGYEFNFMPEWYTKLVLWMAQQTLCVSKPGKNAY